MRGLRGGSQKSEKGKHPPWYSKKNKRESQTKTNDYLSVLTCYNTILPFLNHVHVC